MILFRQNLGWSRDSLALQRVGRLSKFRALVAAASLGLVACQLLPFFDAVPCETGQTELRPCGACDAALSAWACSDDRAWVMVESCGVNPCDIDGDGAASPECWAARAACADAPVDCDDQDPDRWIDNADLDGDRHAALTCGGDDCDDEDELRWAGHADLDGDGRSAESCGGDDCDDEDPERWTGHADLDGDSHDAESCGGDDCNDEDRLRWTGHADLDGDDHDHPRCGGDDCDDDCATCHPGASPSCGAEPRDHDCDGVIDELGGCGACAPSDMSLVGGFPSGIARSLFVANSYAYVVGDEGLTVVDLLSSFGSRPLPLPDARSVVVKGSRAYVASLGFGTYTVDVRNPELGSLTPFVISGPIRTGASRGLVVSGEHLYVAGPDGLWAADLIDPLGPDVVSGPEFWPWDVDFMGMAVSDDHLYVGDRFSDVAIFDISDAARPILVSGTEEGLGSADVFVLPPHLYVASQISPGGLHVYASDPTSPTPLGYTENTGRGRALFVVEEGPSARYAYVAADGGVLHAVNVTDPSSPAVVSSLEGLPVLHDVFVSGPRAYLATEEGLVVVDLGCEGPDAGGSGGGW